MRPPFRSIPNCFSHIKSIVLTVLISVLASCESKQTAAPAKTLNYSTLTFDSLTLKQLILENDKLLDIVKIELPDWKKSKKINELLQSAPLESSCINGPHLILKKTLSAMAQDIYIFPRRNHTTQ